MSKIGGLIFEQKAPNEEDPTKPNYSWRFRESVFEDVHHCAIYWEKMQLDMEHPRAPPFDCWHRSWKYRVHRLIHQRSSKSVGIGRHTCIGRHPMGDSRNEKNRNAKDCARGCVRRQQKGNEKKNKRNQQRERERERQISVPDTDNNKRCRLGFKLFGLLDLRKERERERSTKPDKRYAWKKKKRYPRLPTDTR